MKDIHNHILYGIDDGAKDIESAIKALDFLEKSGVSEIVLTPHFIKGTKYNSNNIEKEKLLNSLKNKTNIKLYLGNEVFIDNGIPELIDNNEISSINKTKYVLVELSLHEELNKSDDILFFLRSKGFVPIIAHPERYHYISLDKLIKYIDMGCLLQGNLSSLEGFYGKEAKHNIKLLLRKNMIHIMGTDYHTKVTINIINCEKILSKIVSKNIYEDLLHDNFDKIVNNKKIEIYEIKKIYKFKKEIIK